MPEVPCAAGRESRLSFWRVVMIDSLIALISPLSYVWFSNTFSWKSLGWNFVQSLVFANVIGGIATLDLNAARRTCVGVHGEKIVARVPGVGLQRLNALDQEVSEDEEFGAFSFEAGVSTSYCLISHGRTLGVLFGHVGDSRVVLHG